jgi:hypothetical protein
MNIKIRYDNTGIIHSAGSPEHIQTINGYNHIVIDTEENMSLIASGKYSIINDNLSINLDYVEPDINESTLII